MLEDGTIGDLWNLNSLFIERCSNEPKGAQTWFDLKWEFHKWQQLFPRIMMGGQCETRSNGTGPSTNRPDEDGRYKENNPKSLPLAVACSRGGVSGLPASGRPGPPPGATQFGSSPPDAACAKYIYTIFIQPISIWPLLRRILHSHTNFTETILIDLYFVCHQGFFNTAHFPSRNQDHLHVMMLC